MKQVKGQMVQIPATVISLLGIQPPDDIPPPMDYSGLEAKNLIIALIDNFGLFECVTFQPRFMIGNADLLYALETSNPLADGVLNDVVTGGNPEFNLFDFLASEDFKVAIIGRLKYIQNMATYGDIIPVENDHGVYVESVKVVNRRNVTVLHFNDFEQLYVSSGTLLDKETMAKKMITRTDSWLLTIMSYARPETTMLIISNNGRNEPMNYPPELQQRRAASLPIAIGIRKKQQ
ncbi:MAG: hypothetical protein QXL15_01480 [Candidatus Korarchaeota archaeon]